MKYLLNTFMAFIIILAVAACSKTGFIESPDARLNVSTDTLRFDTVFTSAGSITQSFKIFNQNDRKLKLSYIKLMGGTGSAFRMNVDGTAGTDIKDLELEPNDSLYVFVSVTINPNTQNLPFIVNDSVQISYNGNSRFIQLEAFGQNAIFLRNKRVTRDSTWNNNLPVVILGGVTVDSNVTLTINKGCRIYVHANAPILVNGTLKINGEVAENSQVVFRGDRLDPYYRDLPGSWPGIYFSESSDENSLNYAVIKNAYQAIITRDHNSDAKIALNNCVLDNIYDAGISSVGSSIRATNCLITNCGANISISAGGNYTFDHCTVATIGNTYINHKNPVLYVTDQYNQNSTFPLTARFTNCIFYGESGITENEVVVERKGNASTFNVLFENILYKNKTVPSGINFINSLNNHPPQFDSINAGRNYFDFHLKSTSLAVDNGKVSNITLDLDGKTRDATPDIGCYER